MSSPQRGQLGIALSKFVVLLITGAASMLAEAIHSFADTGNQALLFLGGNRALRPATREHPFGFGRERYFWAFVVAIMLFTLGGLFALYEGITRMIDPQPVLSAGWALATLLVAMVLEGLSFRTGRQLPRRTGLFEMFVEIIVKKLGALLGTVAKRNRRLRSDRASDRLPLAKAAHIRDSRLRRRNGFYHAYVGRAVRAGARQQQQHQAEPECQSKQKAHLRAPPPFRPVAEASSKPSKAGSNACVFFVQIRRECAPSFRKLGTCAGTDCSPYPLA